METLESSRVCRLCGKQSGISINIFDKNENHVRKINSLLPIMVHEMDLLPKHMCHRCGYKLKEFHKFYIDCLKTDTDLKSQLSWMRKEVPKERIGVPMVHIENIKIKIESPDYYAYDMSPVIDNVNYINSMSPVTFQSNDIPYTTCAGCRCCCDKMDQSNQTVSSNYENAIPRCDRLSHVQMDNVDGSIDDSQAVKKNLIVDKMYRKQPRSTTKNPRGGRSVATSFNRTNVKPEVRMKKEASQFITIHNLRPRKGSVDYVGTKKKSSAISMSKTPKTKMSTLQSVFDATRIEPKKLDDFQDRRILRPRKGTIDYWGTKKKCSKLSNKNQRLQNNKYRMGKHKVRNIASKLKPSSKRVPKLSGKRVKVVIKEDPVSDFEDAVFDESILSVMMPKKFEANSIDSLVNKIDALPKGILVNVQSDWGNCSLLNCPQQGSKFSVSNELKPLPSELKSERIDSDRIDPVDYSSKHLRNHDVHFRGKKVKRFGNAKASTTKLRRTLRNITDRGKLGRNLVEAVTGIVGTKKISTSMKLFNKHSIKHYCEECNMSFPNRELFKLHAC